MTHFGWILNPAAQYAALGLSLVAFLMLFIGAKMEIAKGRRLARESCESLAASVRGLTADIEGVRESVQNIETKPAIFPRGREFNLSKRGQALRMHHRGESVPSIAAALQTPRNEVELLLKVHQLTNCRIR